MGVLNGQDRLADTKCYFVRAAQSAGLSGGDGPEEWRIGALELDCWSASSSAYLEKLSLAHIHLLDALPYATRKLLRHSFFSPLSQHYPTQVLIRGHRRICFFAAISTHRPVPSGKDMPSSRTEEPSQWHNGTRQYAAACSL